MNWYIKQLFQEGRWFSKEEIKNTLNLILNEEMNENKIKDPTKRERILSRIVSVFNNFPPGSKFRREGNGWTIADPQENILSFNEIDLRHAIPGGAARFQMMDN